MTLPLAASLIIPGCLLILAVLIAGRMRLRPLIALFRLQSAFLALYALVLAVARSETELFAIAALVLVMKGVVIPEFLLRAARVSGASDRLSSYMRATTSTFAAVLASVLAYIAARAILPLPEGDLAIISAFSLVLIGILLLVSRRDMFGQGVGFLVMENGIFALGLALTGGMPLFVEIGVFFDLMTLFILMTLLVRRAQREHASVTTDYLRGLID